MIEGSEGTAFDTRMRQLMPAFERTVSAWKLNLENLSIGLVLQLAFSCCVVLLLSKVLDPPTMYSTRSAHNNRQYTIFTCIRRARSQGLSLPD